MYKVSTFMPTGLSGSTHVLFTVALFMLIKNLVKVIHSQVAFIVILVCYR